MYKNFYIFRHGQTDYNEQRRCQGCKCDRQLNETGIKQAEKLATYLSSFSIDKIYTSPLKRAVQTADIIAETLKIDSPIKEENLREGNYGEVEGLTEAEINTKYPGLFEKFCNATQSNWDIKFPGNGSESKRQIFERAYAALLRIASLANGENIAISTHAGVIHALACGMDLWKVNYDNCAVLHIQYDSVTNKFRQIF